MPAARLHVQMQCQSAYQIKPVSVDRNYTQLLLPWISFVTAKTLNLLFFSDSMSSLEALNGFKIEVDLALKIIKDYTSLMKAGKVIEFCWIPSHVNIRDNERADTAAKDALSLPPFSMKLGEIGVTWAQHVTWAPVIAKI